MRRLVLLLLALMWAGAARANCAAAPGALAFTASSSYDVRAGSVPSVAGQAGLSCSGPFLALLGGSYARATVTSANGFRLIAGGSDAIPYRASADAAGNHAFTQGSTINYFDPALVALLGIGGSGTFVPPLYGRLTASPNVAAGVYRDTLTVVWNWSVCDGVQATTLACVPAYTTGQATVTIAVTLVVGRDCRIVAADIDFGSVALVAQFSDVRGAVLVSCTKDASYTVAFTSGQSGASRPWRRMADGAGHTLQYNLYRPDGGVWDEASPLPAVAPGTGDATPSQAQSYVARINADQTTPPAGQYSDTVNVVVSF